MPRSHQKLAGTTPAPLQKFSKKEKCSTVTTKRKPVVKPMAVAVEELYWRGKIACEILDGLELPIQAQEPVRRFLLATGDYEASKLAVSPTTVTERKP